MPGGPIFSLAKVPSAVLEAINGKKPKIVYCGTGGAPAPGLHRFGKSALPGRRAKLHAGGPAATLLTNP